MILVQDQPQAKVQDAIQKVTKSKKDCGVGSAWLEWQSACLASGEGLTTELPTKQNHSGKSS
jgi:hypothetical protein